MTEQSGGWGYTQALEEIRAEDEAARRARSNGQDDAGSPKEWQEPDMSVLRLHRRPPPVLPLSVFGGCASWIAKTAEAAACPIDYVAVPLLASASAWTCKVGAGDARVGRAAAFMDRRRG
jgi:hypothetical protein